MALSDRQLLHSLSRIPFIDSAELAGILGEPHATVHCGLADGIVGCVTHGTAHLPSSQRYHLTAKGVGETARVLGFETPSDFVRAYPMSREWLTLLLRRMDAVAAVCGTRTTTPLALNAPSTSNRARTQEHPVPLHADGDDSGLGSYLHHTPSVNARLSQRVR